MDFFFSLSSTVVRFPQTKSMGARFEDNSKAEAIFLQVFYLENEILEELVRNGHTPIMNNGLSMSRGS